MALSLAAGTTRVARSAPVGSVGWLARRHRRSSAPEPGLGLTNARLGRRRDRALLPIPRGGMADARRPLPAFERVEHAVGRADAAALGTTRVAIARVGADGRARFGMPQEVALLTPRCTFCSFIPPRSRRGSTTRPMKKSRGPGYMRTTVCSYENRP